MIEDIQIDDNNAMRGFYEDLDGYNYTGYYYRQFNEPDEILENIKQYNPNVFRRFASLGIPFPLAQNMVRRIIKLTLNYSK